MTMRPMPRHRVVRHLLPGGRVEVYRRDDALVHGPAMSLHLGGCELMRWDLQPGIAHTHWAVGRAPRLYMPRDWPLPTLAELACSQLVEHARVVAVLARCPRAVRPRRSVLVDAARWALPEILDRGQA